MRRKDWEKASERVGRAINREISPILRRACERTLAKFPRARYVGIREAMGSAWIEIDGLAFHAEADDDDVSTQRYHVVGYKSPHDHKNRGFRMIRAHRLHDLTEAMLECADFLDEFRAGYPYITAERNPNT